MAWAWILGFLGVVAWKLRKANLDQSPLSSASSSSSSSVLQLGRRANLGIPLLQHQQVLQAAASSESAKKQKKDTFNGHESPLIIFTCKRAQYLSKTLDDILQNIPHACRFGCPIVISEDGVHPAVNEVVLEYKSKFEDIGVPLYHIQHRGSASVKDPYHALSQHYGWALNELFQGKIDPMLPIPQRVIILEEDLNTAPDFFSYMEATSKLLDNDPSLFAVSAFSDNGHLVSDPKRLLRSDFFPGLGWMMARALWSELESKWPQAYWDDWLREPQQRKNRQVIRPEVSRTYHFGSKGGASHNQFGSILERVKLNRLPIDWIHEDISYLRESDYNNRYAKELQAAKRVSSFAEAQTLVKSENVRLEYTTFREFQKFARILNIMDDEKATIPRTAYKGVIETRPDGNHLLFMTPPIDKLRSSFPGIL